MQYKIIGVLIHNRKTVGYKLQDANGNILNLEAKKVIELSILGQLINATYNKYRDSLAGVNGTNLNTLPKYNITSSFENNHVLMDRYNAKLKALGV